MAVLSVVSTFNDKGIRAANRDLAKLQAAAKKSSDGVAAGFLATSRTLNNASGTMSRVGSSMTRNVTVPMIGIGAIATKMAVDFESSFAEVKKSVGGGEADLAALRAEILRASKTHPISASAIAEVYAMGGQLGVTKKELGAFADAAIGMSVATNLSLDEGGSQMAKFSNIMGTSSREGVKGFSKLGSSLVALGNEGASTEADIMAMAMRIAGAGKQVGMSEGDVLGLANALSSMGIEAESGGSAISKTMSEIDKTVAMSGMSTKTYAREFGVSMKVAETATANNSFALKVWAETAGMSAKDFKKAWENDSTGALQRVFAGMGKVKGEGGNLNVLLERLGTTELRQSDMLKRVSGASDLLTSSVKTGNKAWDENAAMQREVDARYATTGAKLLILKNRAVDTGITLGDTLAPAMMDSFDAAEPLLRNVKSLADGFAALSTEQQTSILKAVGVVAVFGPVVKIFSPLVGGLSKATRGAGALKLAFGAGSEAAPKWAQAVAGGAKGIGNFTAKAVKANVEMVKWVAQQARLGAAMAGSFIKNLASTVVELAKSAAAWVVDTAKKAANTAATVAHKAAQIAANVATKAWAAGQWLLNAALTANPIGLIVAAIALLIGGLVYAYQHSDKFREVVTKAWAAIKIATVNAFNSVVDFFKKWGPKILLLLGGPVAWAVAFVVKNWSTIKEKTVSAFNGAKDAVVNAFTKLKNGAIEKATALVTWVKTLPGKVVTAIGNLATKLYGQGKAIIQGFLDGAKRVWENVKSWVNGLGKWIADHKGPISEDRKLLEPAGRAIIKGLHAGLRAEWPTVTSLLGSYTRAFSSTDFGLGGASAPAFAGASAGGRSRSLTIQGGINVVLPAGTTEQTQRAAGDGVLAALAREWNRS